jgi:hypothetical protein
MRKCDEVDRTQWASPGVVHRMEIHFDSPMLPVVKVEAIKDSAG